MKQVLDKYQLWALWNYRRIGEWADCFLWWLLTGLLIAVFFLENRNDYCFIGVLAKDIPDYAPSYLNFPLLRFCGGAAFWPALVAAWLCMVLLHLFCFLLPSRRASIGLKAAGIDLHRTGGADVSTLRALWYVIIRYLPTHLFCGYLLLKLLHTALDFHVTTSAVIVTAAVQMIWTLPLFFLGTRRNLADILSGTEMRLNEKSLGRIEALRQSRFRNAVRPLRMLIETGSYVLLLLFFLVPAVQILRDPAVHPEYEALLYGGQTALWEDNAYFALEGLNAPQEVEDSYGYGRYRTTVAAGFYRRLLEQEGMTPDYTVPPPEKPAGYIAPTRKNRLSFYGDTNVLSCFNVFFQMDEESRKACLETADLNGMIWDNYILWERFEVLRNYQNFSIPPQFGGGRFDRRALADIARVKSAHLVYLASQGYTEDAVAEWVDYMRLYRQMLESSASLRDKATYMLMTQSHFNSFQEILSHAPDAVMARYDDVVALLTLDPAKTPFLADRLLVDDWALREPVFLSIIGGGGNTRNRLYECLIPAMILGRTPADFLPERHRSCSLRRTHRYELLALAMTDPGNFLTNALYYMLYRGVIQGEEMVYGMHTLSARWRMALLGLQILKEGAAPENVAIYTEKAPEHLRNPFTKQSFEWDAQKRRLFFKHYKNDLEVPFYLPI
ncbi:MAG: hypothetical protein EP349_04125 [Alphaproteobacteria bacterium]|nr:MAG: hypothetical protein EP349_04125 [Alphaproteobacteria bacterium]